MNEDILQYLEEQEANDEACHEEVLALAEIRRLRAALQYALQCAEWCDVPDVDRLREALNGTDKA